MTEEVPLVVTNGDRFELSKEKLSLDVAEHDAELTTEQAFILNRMVRLAPKIRNNKQLKQIIRDADASTREALYELLKPHLSFKPAPYLLIKP